MSIDLEGRVMWITGASGTLGKAIGSALARHGARVVVSSRSVVAYDDESRIHHLPLDINDREAVDRAADAIVVEHGRLDGLVTATTLPIFGDFLELDDDHWRQVIETKFLGTVRAVRAALPHFLRRGEGRVVVLSGRGALQPAPLHLPGSSVNGALNTLIAGLSARYGPRGVRFNALSPGSIRSPRLETLVAAGPGASFDAVLPYEGLPEDVAAAAVFLLSDQARFIAGHNMFVDGGGRPQR